MEIINKTNSDLEEKIHSTTNRIYNYIVEPNEPTILSRSLVKVTAVFTAFTFPDAVSMYSKNQEPNPSVYSNENKASEDKLINNITNVVNSFIIDEKGMRLLANEDDVRQRDLDNVKENIEAKLDTVNTKLEHLSKDITGVENNMNHYFTDIKDIVEEIKTTIDGLPTKDFVNNTTNKILIKISGGTVIIIGLIIAYLEWRFVN